MPKEQAKTKKKTNYLAMFFGIAVVVFVLLALYTHIVPNVFENMDDRAGFGDMYGAFEALFSGLAFAGVLVAIFMQRDELRLQREELALTREELHIAAEAQEKSAQALEDQLDRTLLAAQIQAVSSIAASNSSAIAVIRVAETTTLNDALARVLRYEREKLEETLKKRYTQLNELLNYADLAEQTDQQEGEPES